MADQPEGRNRRRYERREYVARVSMKTGDGTSVLPVGNISAGGIYLKLKRGQIAGIALGEDVIVYFDVGPDEYGDALDLEVDAEVVRVDMGGLDRDPGIALMWTSTDPLVAQQLALVLAHLQKLA
jgi:hypothetical protein